MRHHCEVTTGHRAAGRRPRRSGASAVEFALIAPFLVTLILGMIEFGRVMMVEQILVNAAREGARAAVLPGSSASNARTVVTNYLSSSSITLSNPTSQVSVSPDPSTSTPGTAITVTITVPFNNLSWLPFSVFMGGKSLSGSAVMRLESTTT